MFRQVGLFASLAVFTAAMSVSAGAGAQDGASPGKIDNTHQESRRVNQGNTRVIHAGPGAPAVGAVHVPPAQAKRDGAKKD